ncbi:MAG: NAD(P)H-dependent oxidoreductase [Hydrogenophaga sp.]|uniref:NAD(P)H-dependent oxidoreductase n=1 Tax=Hydrogenophaga sp. TaxID=1904254 RepID=UPI002727B12A|nr:NAD(P)H-dependent oxidoreductase [Hydrogenophaga sp.]MDO8887689.1 NAD(P)H-dependent oxidoreductase [Hydrogenophaga sp.]MDP2076386.1 NAD(P)H-dependent oxidoreductase [Hydrogenophaga sp.]MDP2251246.1 NAD(P)H-dependent oxidoreductase [Hydrogenophaga sp.]MDP3109644.1 NAD(P)H-dependent oxidoreductase [Hydrogenophaga sp.]MDZ4129432.1 NAD(P)H-dependent oxidoreductase [Hydrogenophaga sp.]
MKRIFILNGHPAETSLSRTLVEAYADAARQAGHEVRLTHLHDLHFDTDFGWVDFENPKPLEPALEQLLQDLSWSEHFMMSTPMWWGGLPAKLKGLFDRALLPGRAFDTRNKTLIGLPRPMLTGRTARVVITSDTPGWFMRLAYKNALIWQLRRQILEFVGLKPTRLTHLGPASEPKAGEVARWVAQVRRLGSQAA